MLLMVVTGGGDFLADHQTPEAQKPKTFRIASFYAQKFSGRSARIHFSRHIKKARNFLLQHIKKARNPLSRHIKSV